MCLEPQAQWSWPTVSGWFLPCPEPVCPEQPSCSLSGSSPTLACLLNIEIWATSVLYSHGIDWYLSLSMEMCLLFPLLKSIYSVTLAWTLLLVFICRIEKKIHWLNYCTISFCACHLQQIQNDINPHSSSSNNCIISTIYIFMIFSSVSCL
jgi:hypothetical protein